MSPSLFEIYAVLSSLLEPVHCVLNVPPLTFRPVIYHLLLELCSAASHYPSISPVQLLRPNG